MGDSQYDWHSCLSVSALAKTHGLQATLSRSRRHPTLSMILFKLGACTGNGGAAGRQTRVSVALQKSKLFGVKSVRFDCPSFLRKKCRGTL